MFRSKKKVVWVNDMETLEKALHPKDINNLKEGTNPEQQTDHNPHLEPLPSDVDQLVNSPDLGRRNSAGGISTKAVYNTGENTYMFKPYHKHIEPDVSSYRRDNISGWATMATKDLFNSADLGKNIEDVIAGKIGDTPVTIHKFGKNLREINDFRYTPGLIEKEPAYKIGVMDYLTNNSDRHGQNLMIDLTNGEPVGIDHERNFQYHRAPNNKWGEKNTYSTDLGMFLSKGDGIQNVMSTIDKPEPQEHKNLLRNTAEWFNTHHNNIEASFRKNLKHIKDNDVKNHIESNFMERLNKLREFFDPINKPYEKRPMTTATDTRLVPRREANRK
jgi:hypothetical protein